MRKIFCRKYRKDLAILRIFILFTCFLIPTAKDFATSEEVTIRTYYPAPYGTYVELRSDRLAVGSRYRNQPISDGILIVEETIGVGVTNPDQNLSLDISRPIRIGHLASLVCDATKEGTIRYNYTLQQFQSCTRNVWRRLGGIQCQQVSAKFSVHGSRSVQDMFNNAEFFIEGVSQGFNMTSIQHIAELQLIDDPTSRWQHRIALVCVGEFRRTGCYLQDSENTHTVYHYVHDLFGNVEPANACVITDRFLQHYPTNATVTLSTVCCR